MRVEGLGGMKNEMEATIMGNHVKHQMDTRVFRDWLRSFWNAKKGATIRINSFMPCP